MISAPRTSDPESPKRNGFGELCRRCAEWVLRRLYLIVLSPLVLVTILITSGFLWDRWYAAVFWSYLGFGIMHSVAFVLYRLGILRSKALVERIRHVIAQTGGPVTRGARIKNAMATAVGICVFGLTWPSLMIFAALRQRDRTKLPPKGGTFANERYGLLMPIDHVVSLTMLVLSATGLGLLHRSGYQSAYTFVFLFLMMSQVALRHILYLLQSLPKKLRQNFGSPYGRFVAIAVCDYLVLLLTLAPLRASAVPETASFASLAGTAKLLFAPEGLRQAVAAPLVMPFFDILTLAVGVLYYASVFTSLVRFRDFRRSDEDLHAMATNANLSGCFTDCLRILAKVKNPGQQTFRLKAVAYLGVGEINHAMAWGKRAWDEDGVSLQGVPVVERVLSEAFMHPIPPENLEAFLRGADLADCSDARLTRIVLSTTNLLGLSSEILRDVLLKNEQRHRFPLSDAALLLASGQHEAARMHLGNLKPGAPQDGVLLQFLRLIAELQAGSSGEGLSSALSAAISDFVRELDAVPGSASSREDTLVLLSLGHQVLSLSQNMEHPQTERLKFILDGLRSKIPPEQRSQVEELMNRLVHTSAAGFPGDLQLH